MTVAALVHAMGININGRWRWSPVLRLTGMICHAVAFFYLASLGSASLPLLTYRFILSAGLSGLIRLGLTLTGWKDQTQWKPI